MKTLKKPALCLATGFVGALLIAGVATAASETKVVAAPLSDDDTIKYVSYADLEIGSDTGMATLRNRIEHAAREVCGSSDFRRAGGFRQASRNAQCQEEAVAEALRQLPMDSIAAAH